MKLETAIKINEKLELLAIIIGFVIGVMNIGIILNYFIANIELTGIIIGIILCWFLGYFVEYYVKSTTDNIKRIPPPGLAENEWIDLINYQNKGKAGQRLGILERLLSFGAFYLSNAGYAIIGGWLAFKLGSKWEVWKNIIQVPVTISKPEGQEDNKHDYRNLLARSRWGGWLMMRFLIGTLLNILIGFGLALLLKAIVNKKV